jgi:hypothetical protein
MAPTIELQETERKYHQSLPDTFMAYTVVVDGVAVGYVRQSRVGWWQAVPFSCDGIPAGAREWKPCKTQDAAISHLTRRGLVTATRGRPL